LRYNFNGLLLKRRKVGDNTNFGGVLQKVYQQAKINIDNLPDGIILEWRDGFWVGVNYSDQPYNVSIPSKAKILVGTKLLKPADVVVWKE
jgi:beta-galactosidase